MKSRHECRIRHLTVSMNVRRKKARLLDLPQFLRILASTEKYRTPVPIDSRHVLRLEDIRLDCERNTATLLVSCSDKDGRDASFADCQTFKRRRVPKLETEGVASSAHLMISLGYQPGMTMLHPAIMEESEGLYRARVESFLTGLAASLVPTALLLPSDGNNARPSGDERARIRFDVFNDLALKDIAEKVQLREILVVGSAEPDPDFHMEHEQIVKFRVSVSGLEEAKSAVGQAWKCAKGLIAKPLNVILRVNRPDGHGTTIRVPADCADPLAEAFQRIDVLDGFTALQHAPEQIVPELQERMFVTLQSRLAEPVHTNDAESDTSDGNAQSGAALQPA